MLGCLSLAEAFQAAFVRAQGGRQDLDRNLSVQFAILGEVYFTHAALAQSVEYPVMSEHGADHETVPVVTNDDVRGSRY